MPDQWVQAEPGLRKAGGRWSVGLGRGIAAVQRRLKLMNKIAKEKRGSIKKPGRGGPGGGTGRWRRTLAWG